LGSLNNNNSNSNNINNNNSNSNNNGNGNNSNGNSNINPDSGRRTQSQTIWNGGSEAGKDPIVEAVESVRNGDRSGSVWGIVAGVRRRLKGGSAR
jgi:hypothetical protein